MTIRYVILGEDRSDVETLTVLVRRLTQDPRLPVVGKGYSGCSELLRKGARDLNLFLDKGYDRFVIVYDADREDPARRCGVATERIVRQSRVPVERCCVVVPVQEIEAWLLSDLTVVTSIWPRWRPEPVENPERIDDPKEFLERLSRQGGHQRRYNHATDNARLAALIDLSVTVRKCPSFATLAAFLGART